MRTIVKVIGIFLIIAFFISAITAFGAYMLKPEVRYSHASGGETPSSVESIEAASNIREALHKALTEEFPNAENLEFKFFWNDTGLNLYTLFTQDGQKEYHSYYCESYYFNALPAEFLADAEISFTIFDDYMNVWIEDAYEQLY